MTNCNPSYISKINNLDPNVKDMLYRKHKALFDKIREHKTLFRQNTTDGKEETRRYYLPQNIEKYKEAISVINNINKKEGIRVIFVGKLEKDQDQHYVYIDVRPFMDVYERMNNEGNNSITPQGDSVVTALPSSGLTSVTPVPMFEPTTIFGSSGSLTKVNSYANDTVTSGASFQSFNRGSELSQKYPQADKLLGDVEATLEVVDPSTLEKDGQRVKALFDPWTNKIKATKDATPETLMHEIMHAVLFKSSDTKTEDKFKKSALGRDLVKFVDSLRKAEMPESDVVDKVLVGVEVGSVQEGATYGLLNYTFAKALNETISPNQKVPNSVFTDMAKATMKGLVVRPNTKLAELINLIDKHTSGKGVIEQKSEVISPETEAAVKNKIHNLKTIGKDIKLVRGDHGEITFELNDQKIKYDTGDKKLGFGTTVAREVEAKIRKTIESVFNRYVDSDGNIKGTPDGLPKEFIIPESHYNVIDNVISERLKEYPVGTKFFHDKNIYSEVWQKAGRLDFIAIKPNGKADLLSFDLVSKGQYGAVMKDSPMRDVKPKQQEAIRDHLNQLKGILKTAYDIKDFDQVRSVPMYVDVKFDTQTKRAYPADMSWDGLFSNETNAKKIDEIPTWDESTGNKDLDNLIKKLVILYEVKGGEKYSESNTKAKQDIARSIRAIQLGRGLLVLANMIESAAKSSEYTVIDFEKNMKFKDSDKVKLDVMAEQARKLNKSSKELELYSKLYLYYKDIYPDPTAKEKEKLDRLKATCDRAGLALSRLDDVKREFIQEKVAQKFGVEELLLPEARVGAYAEYTNTFSNPVTKAQYVFQRMLRNTRSAYEVNIQDDLAKLNKIYADIQEWTKGRSNKDLLDLIKRKDEHGNRVNELISEFKKDFFVTAKKKSEELSSGDENIAKAALAWFKENTDQDALRKWAAKAKAEELLKLDQSMDPSHFYFQDRQDKIHAKYNTDKSGIYKMYNVVKHFPVKSKWHSDEYIAITKPENKPVYDLYKFALDVNKRASNLGYIEAEKSSRFLPFLHKSLVEKFVLGGSWSLTDSILNDLTVSRTDTDYGAWDRIANEPIDRLVKYFTGDFGKEVIGPDGKKRIDHSNVSDDIVKNLALYAGKVREYEGKSEIEDVVKLLLWAEKNKESLQTNQFGNVVEDAEPFTNNEANYKLLKDFVQNQFYDQHLIKSKFTDSASESFTNSFNKMAAKINKVAGKELIREEKEERRFSIMKTMQAAQALQTLKVLGLNLGSAVTNFIGAQVQGLIETGDYYTTKEWFASELNHGKLQFYKGDAELHVAMMKAFWPADNQRKREVDKLSLSKLTAASVSDMMMRMMESANDYVSYINFDAIMKNTVLIDGKLYNARKYVKQQTAKDRYATDRAGRKEIEGRFEEDVKKLIEDHGVIKKASVKDGKLIIEGLDMKSENVAVYKDLIRNTGRKISGSISPENESRIRMTVLGRQLIMFKSWLPGMIHTRFTGLAHNEGLQDYEWGRMRMCLKLIFKYGLRSIDKMASMYKATEKGVDLMTQIYENKKSIYEKNGKQFNLTKEEFYDLMRKNIAKQAKELSYMIALMSLATMTMSFAHDHKDDESRGFYAFSARLMNRSFEEINLYYNPVSLNAIVNGSLFPTLGLLTDMARFAGNLTEEMTGQVIGDEEMIKDAHPTKYALKTVPIFSQVPNYLAIVLPDIAKELGITVKAQTIKH